MKKVKMMKKYAFTDNKYLFGILYILLKLHYKNITI